MPTRLGTLRRSEDYLRGDDGTDLPDDIVLHREDARQRCALFDISPSPRANFDWFSQVFREAVWFFGRNVKKAELICYDIEASDRLRR